MNKYAEEMEKIALARLAKYFQSAYAEGRAVSPGILDRVAASSKGEATAYAGIPRGASRPEMGVPVEQRRAAQREMEASKPMWRNQAQRRANVNEHMDVLQARPDAAGHRDFFKQMDERTNGIRGMMESQRTSLMYP